MEKRKEKKKRCTRSVHEMWSWNRDGLFWRYALVGKFFILKDKENVSQSIVLKQEWSLLRVFFGEEFVYLEIHGDLFIVLSWNGVGLFFFFLLFNVSKHLIGSFSLHFWPFPPLGLVSSKNLLLARVSMEIQRDLFTKCDLKMRMVSSEGYLLWGVCYRNTQSIVDEV